MYAGQLRGWGGQAGCAAAAVVGVGGGAGGGLCEKITLPAQ